MSTPPANWYDDPEDPTQYRYWDGSNWTAHRSPKRIPSPPGHTAGGSAWNIFPVAFNAIGAVWRSLLLLSLPNLVMSGVVLVAAYATLDQIFEGELEEIIDRVSDGVFSDADERYFDSIDPEFPVPMLWVLIVAVLLSILVATVVSAALSRTTAAAIRGRELEPGAALRGAGRRLGRIIGWLVVAGVAVILALTPILVLPPLLLLYLPLAIWLSPFWVAFVASLPLAPVGESPFRQAARLVRGRWGRAAARSLVLTLLWLSVGFGTSIVGQIFAFDIRASLIGSAVLQVVQGVLVTAGLVAWWTELEGPLDAEIENAPLRAG